MSFEVFSYSAPVSDDVYLYVIIIISTWIKFTGNYIVYLCSLTLVCIYNGANASPPKVNCKG